MNTHIDALTAVNENLANTNESFAEIMQAAMNGDAEAQYKLGRLYHQNAWYDEVSEEAVNWLERAAEQGHIEALYELGVLSSDEIAQESISLREAPTEALKLLRLAAEQGHISALEHIINIYEDGLAGVQKDPVEAAKWQLRHDNRQRELGIEVDGIDSIRQRAEAGDRPSQEKLARWFALGHAPIEVNDDEAVKWHSLAAEHQNVDESPFYYEKEREIFSRLADRCGAQLQRSIGEMYARGYGVKESNVEAVRWYKLAAEKGDASAQHKLALSYLHGHGTTQSDDEAEKWYVRAAEQGHREAQYELALMYSNGQGVSQSDELAAKWYERAAEQGHGGAQNNLGTMYDSGRGVKQNYRTAIKWFRCAAKQGEMIGQYNMGLMYLYGQGVKANDQNAAQWFRQSSESGYVWGTVALAAITGKRDDLARAVEKLFDAHLDAYLGKMEDCTLQLENFDARFKSLIEHSHAPRGQEVWEAVHDDDSYDTRHFVKVLSIEARVATTLRGMLALVQEEPDEQEAKTCFELTLKKGDPLAAYYLAKIANRNSAYDQALKYLGLPFKKAEWPFNTSSQDIHKHRINNDPAYSSELVSAIEALILALRDEIQVNREKEKTHKETLSFLTHTLNNALSTGPETVRTVIDILGSDLYDQGQAEYKAINNMASLFHMFLFAESLLKTFKLYISDPEQIREKWKSDKVGDANISLVIAMALRQSVARLVFSSNHLAQLKRLLPSQDKDAIKNIRKSFVDEIIPLEISMVTASKVFDWVNAHFSALRIEIAPDAEMAFTSNATRYMFFFAAFSELIYNALKYSDGREPIVVKWFRQGDDYCFSCVNSCQLASASQPLQEGSNKGLFFIDKLMSMLEDSRLNSQLENGEYRAMLQFGHDNFGGNIA